MLELSLINEFNCEIGGQSEDFIDATESSCAIISCRKQAIKLEKQQQPRAITSRQSSCKGNGNMKLMQELSLAPRPRFNWLLILTLFIILIIATIECHNFKRTQYHEQGVHGPKSYKFGYTAGDHKNPQERHEVSDGHGHVKGWYSYVDANGKHQVVHYEAHPKYGFKVFNHKAKAYNNGKRHYNS